MGEFDQFFVGDLLEFVLIKAEFDFRYLRTVPFGATIWILIDVDDEVRRSFDRSQRRTEPFHAAR